MSDNKRRLTYLSDIDGLTCHSGTRRRFIPFKDSVLAAMSAMLASIFFFVISGFLISGLIRDRVETGTFSFSDFLCPTDKPFAPGRTGNRRLHSNSCDFYITTRCTGILCPISSSSGIQLLQISFFILNLATGTQVQSLNRCYICGSLGIEEQFYLFWPGLMLLLANTSRATYQLGLIAIFITSLLACVIQTPVDSAATFYLLPFRVWQFALGAMAIEIWRNSALEPFMQLLIRSTGLALCGFSIADLQCRHCIPRVACAIAKYRCGPSAH